MTAMLFFRDRTGKYRSDDEDINYSLIKGKRLNSFFRTEEGMKIRKRSVVFSTDQGKLYIEGDDEVFRKCEAERKHSSYLRKYEYEKGPALPFSGFRYKNSDGLGDEIKDMKKCRDTENSAIGRAYLSYLHKALGFLSDKEYLLISMLYLRKDHLIECEAADLLGMSQQNVNYRKKRILEKLKACIESLASEDLSYRDRKKI